jgi:Protein of unknown function (DUF2934)
VARRIKSKSKPVTKVAERQSKNHQERTAELAYELWERRGRPIGSPEVDWMAAEETLLTSQVSSEAEQPKRAQEH